MKIIALAYYHRDVQAFPDEWDPVRLLHGDADGDIERFVDIIQMAVFNTNGDKGNLLCPMYFSLRQKCARAGAMMEYWQGAFAQTMPEVRFKGRGWDTGSGQGCLSLENSVVVLSEHCITDPNGRTKKLTCSCSRELAPTRRCRSCKCAKRGKPCVAIACGCKGSAVAQLAGQCHSPPRRPLLTRSQRRLRKCLREPQGGGAMIGMKMVRAADQQVKVTSRMGNIAAVRPTQSGQRRRHQSIIVGKLT